MNLISGIALFVFGLGGLASALQWTTIIRQGKSEGSSASTATKGLLVGTETGICFSGLVVILTNLTMGG